VFPRTRLHLWIVVALWTSACLGQTTQGLISGRVVDALTGAPVVGATVACTASSAEIQRKALTGASGFYYLPLLSAGTYRITVSAPAFQQQEVNEIELYVASRIELNFRLRPLSDVWEKGQYRSVFLPGTKAIVPFFGPDVDPSHALLVGPPKGPDDFREPTISEAIDPGQVSNLPFSGRNVYELLLFQPGVTSGLSVNGQRPGSGLFLLDGIDSNTSFGPEFIQEYRVSTNNFSAELGRATGFVANAVTRSGSSAFHGLAYAYIDNEALDANAFQSNTNGFPRPEHRERHAGGWAGGPAGKKTRHFFVGYEDYRTRTAEYPFSYQVPVLDSFRNCPLAAGSQALALLERFPPPLVKAPGSSPCDNLSAPYLFSNPIAIDRGFGIARLDDTLRGGRDRISGRVVTSRETDPYAVFSLYSAFTSPRTSGNYSAAATYAASLSATATSEIRAGWLRSTDSIPQQHPEVPELTVGADAGKFYAQGISLPGSSAAAGYATRGDLFEIADSTILVRGRHVVTFGGGFYFRASHSSTPYLQSGQYQFQDLQSFAQDPALAFTLGLARQSVLAGGPYSLPAADHDLRRSEFYGFVQDSFRATSRLGFDLGLRYDSFGATANTGVQDAYIQLGPGASVMSGLPAAQFVFGGGCCRSVSEPDRRDWAGRLGLSYDLTGKGKHVFRAAYGIFYDRQPDASTAYNDQEEVTFFSATGSLTPNYSQLKLDALSGLPNVPIPYLPQPLLLASHLPAPRVQAWFAGVQDSLAGGWSLEVNHTGAVGTNLVARDVINRANSFGTDSSRLNPGLPDISYLSGSGYSQYTALTGLLRHRSRRALFQAAYTWGHSIDNQSDSTSVFTRQFDNQLDRADSDFDQRQNLVMYSVLQLPAPSETRWQRAALGGWQVAGLAGFRAGFPYTLAASVFPLCSGAVNSPNDPVLLNNRPSLAGGVSPVLSTPVAVPGGVQLLNPAAFCNPGDTPGQLGRNSLRGPGFWNVDASIGKAFKLRWLGENGGMQFRADLFNVLNHANLGNPQIAQTGFGTFGQAFYGMHAAPPGSVSVVPLDEVPRRIELQLRVYF